MSATRCRPIVPGLLALLVTATAHAHPPTVTIRYDQPEQFTEAREYRPATASGTRTDYLEPLQHYMRRQAARILQDDQVLEVTITDVDRAGSYLPTATSPYPVRVVSELYPPRINLHFRLTDGQGHVLRQGQRKLIGLGFLQDAPGAGLSTDPLRFEKRLIDRWLRHGADRL